MYLWDFEDGTMQGFELQSGDCGLQPLLYVGSGDDRWSGGGNRWTYGGMYYMNTYLYGSDINAASKDDSKQCVYSDKTHFFNVTPHTEISWYETGQDHSLCLMRLSDDVELLCQRNVFTNYNMQRRMFSSGELSSLWGETAYVALSDKGTTSWGNFQLDNLRVTTIHLGTFSFFCYTHLDGDNS